VVKLEPRNRGVQMAVMVMMMGAVIKPQEWDVLQ
jgi:hypothetical protein